MASKRYDRTAVVFGEAAAPTIVEDMRRYLGLDRPTYLRYSQWIWNIVRHWDLGRSFGPNVSGMGYHVSVKKIIGDKIWLTIALTGFTIMVTWTLAIPIGIYSAVRQHSVGDYVFTMLGFSGLAVPDFLLGLILMYVAFAYFDMSVGGLLSANYQNVPWSLRKVVDLVNHLWIPAVVWEPPGPPV
jgi:peptide/nickel transport system permease protein